MRRLALAVALGAGLATAPSGAHELQTAALLLEPVADGTVRVTLKTPLAADGGGAGVVPRFPSDCRDRPVVRTTRTDSAVIREWHMGCATPIDGMRVRIEGLDPRIPDAVITVRGRDGAMRSVAVDRHDPEAQLRDDGGASGVPLGAYLAIGVEHILLGFDHLLFVLGLLLAVVLGGGGARRLVVAITAFTVAHSLTLAMAVLGFWGLPPKPVELLIALSIVVLARELVEHPRRARSQRPPRLAIRQPAVLAFAFGLLHGFGFAGALADVGLPEQARGWALLLFNLGVEIGQLLFVAVVITAWRLGRHRVGLRLTPLAHGVAIMVGGVATYWALDRFVVWYGSLPGA